MSYKVLNEIKTIGRERWAEFISSHPDRTIFQSPEMYDLYSNTFNFEPSILALEGNDGVLKAILLSVNVKDFKGIIGKLTVRTIIHGGPLIEPSEENKEKAGYVILQALVARVKKKSLYIQFRNLFDTTAIKPSFQRNKFKLEDHLNLIVKTTDPLAVHSGISESKIRQAVTGLKSGCELIQASSEEEVSQFYAILEKLYKRKIKKPIPDKSFFLAFYNCMQKSKVGILMLAKYQGEIIGGMVCPITPGKKLYEWYVCGLDALYHSFHPSVMLTYGAIEYALKNDLPQFDFMGIGTPDEPYGVRDFKLRFGGSTVNYGRYIHINKPYFYGFAKSWFHVFSVLHIV
jgi:serine/alanine adding enzyme